MQLWYQIGRLLRDHEAIRKINTTEGVTVLTLLVLLLLVTADLMHLVFTGRLVATRSTLEFDLGRVHVLAARSIEFPFTRAFCLLTRKALILIGNAYAGISVCVLVLTSLQILWTLLSAFCVLLYASHHEHRSRRAFLAFIDFWESETRLAYWAATTTPSVPVHVQVLWPVESFRFEDILDPASPTRLHKDAVAVFLATGMRRIHGSDLRKQRDALQRHGTLWEPARLRRAFGLALDQDSPLILFAIKIQLLVHALCSELDSRIAEA